MDLFNDNPWVIWVVIAVMLVIIEMFSLDLVLLMFAVGALAAAAVTALGAPLWLAILVFAATSTALLALLRPALVERLHDGPTLTQGHDAQVGRTAVVVEPVDRFNGRVRLAGELWSARADLDEATFDTDTDVSVVRIEGATAVVVAITSPTAPTQES